MKTFLLLATTAMVSITSSAMAEQGRFGNITQLLFDGVKVPISTITNSNGTNSGSYTTGKFKLGPCSAAISHFPNDASCKYKAFVYNNTIAGYGYTLSCQNNLASTISELEQSCGAKSQTSYVYATEVITGSTFTSASARCYQDSGTQEQKYTCCKGQKSTMPDYARNYAGHYIGEVGNTWIKSDFNCEVKNQIARDYITRWEKAADCNQDTQVHIQGSGTFEKICSGYNKIEIIK